jgi:hypothetical protein
VTTQNSTAPQAFFRHPRKWRANKHSYKSSKRTPKPAGILAD